MPDRGNADATGASPALPPIPGIEDVPYLTSTTALELGVLPKSLLVVGGGYVGCELAQLFARANVQVAVIVIVPVLSTADPEFGRALAACFRSEGVALYETVSPQRVWQTNRGIGLSISVDALAFTKDVTKLSCCAG